jgi:hypothetical protein
MSLDKLERAIESQTAAELRDTLLCAIILG